MNKEWRRRSLYEKILKTALTAAVVFLTAAVMTVCASAETEDVEFNVRSENLLRRSGSQQEELLLAAQRRFQQKKAYMEEKT